MSASERKVERVSRAICRAAAMPFHRSDDEPVDKGCPVCYESDGECTMWTTFRTEALAAIRAMRGF